MINYPYKKELLEQFSKNSKIAGIIFLLLGVVGIFFPGIMSIATALFVGWLLLFSGFMAGFHTYKTDKKNWLGWLKTFILIVTGGLVVINPIPGVAALGIIFAVYFLMDSFGSFALAFEMKPEKGWWVVLLNGILSVLMAVIFLVGWPFSSLWLVGLFVGISLLFDGVVLLTLSHYAKKMDEGE
ncbi:MAG: hypothetical protein GXO31_01670 [Epsilonproteobacteria bacterium]|nr:hypothetical protein [Campylobacterota bacterium]